MLTMLSQTAHRDRLLAAVMGDNASSAKVEGISTLASSLSNL